MRPSSIFIGLLLLGGCGGPVERKAIGEPRADVSECGADLVCTHEWGGSLCLPPGRRSPRTNCKSWSSPARRRGTPTCPCRRAYTSLVPRQSTRSGRTRGWRSCRRRCWIHSGRSHPDLGRATSPTASSCTRARWRVSGRESRSHRRDLRSSTSHRRRPAPVEQTADRNASPAVDLHGPRPAAKDALAVDLDRSGAALRRRLRRATGDDQHDSL
jgi:hypothetical protein